MAKKKFKHVTIENGNINIKNSVISISAELIKDLRKYHPSIDIETEIASIVKGELIPQKFTEKIIDEVIEEIKIITEETK